MFRLEGDEFLLTVICKRDERTYDIKMRLLADLDYLQQLVTLSKTTKLTIPAIKTMITGKSGTDSFLNIWEVQPSCTWCRHSFATNLTHAGVPHNYISESMGHSVDSNITNRYIYAFPLAQHMEFNSRLLKLNDNADIMEELKGQ